MKKNTRATTRQIRSLHSYVDKTSWLLTLLAIWLYDHRHDDWESKDFDFPHYGGLPKRLARKLSSDTVDLIQDNLYKLPTVKSPKEVMEWLMHV